MHAVEHDRSGCGPSRAGHKGTARRAQKDRAQTRVPRPELLARSHPAAVLRSAADQFADERGVRRSARPSDVSLPTRDCTEQFKQSYALVRGPSPKAARTTETSPGPARSSRAPAARPRPDRPAESRAARTPDESGGPLRATDAGSSRPAVRPARPARCSAEAFEIGDSSSRSSPVRSSNRSTRARPLSTTLVTPSIVSDVSATFVARITLRRSAGCSTASCCSAGRSPYKGSTARFVAPANPCQPLLALPNLAHSRQEDQAIAGASAPEPA